MATPSVLTVPSMYGDGILYSGPTAYGNQLITNGNFQTDTDWTKGAGVTISNGNANFINAPGVALYQNIGTQSGFVRVEFNITEYTSGTLNVYSGGNQSVGTINVVGNKIGRYTAKVDRNGGNNNIIFGSSDNFTGSITNVSVKEITQGSDFDFTRATTGTRINEDGYIEDVPYNFIPYSQDIDNSDWDKVGITVSANEIIAPDNSLTGDKINENAGGTYHNVNHDDGVTNGTTYTASAYFKAAERTTACIYENLGIGGGSYPLSSFNLSNGTVDSQDANHIAKISSAGSGWYRCSITFTANATRTGSIYYAPNNQLTYTGVLNSGVFMWGAQFVKSDKIKNYLPTTDRVNLPRLNYPVYGGCPSLLLEPQRTNRNSESEDLSQWDPVHGSVSTDLITNPTGNTNKSYWIPDTTNNFHHIDRSSSVTSGLQYTISIFLKSDGSDFTNFVLLNTPQGNADGNAGPIVDIKNGTKVGFNNADYDVNIVDYVNGWRRYAWTVTTNTTTLELNVNPLPTSAISSYNGNGNNGIYVYGLQIEEGSYPTSYMPTSGGTFTRNQDTANNAGLGTTNTFNNSEGVLYCEIKAIANDLSQRRITISDGSLNNRIGIEYTSSSNQIRGRVTSGGSGQADMTYSLIDITQYLKIAVKYKVNDCALYVNGQKVVIDTLATMPVNLDRLSFDQSTSVLNYFGNVKAVAVYKTALTDTELANLTSYNNHDLFIPYRSRMQMISADQELQCTEHDITRFL